MLEGIGYFFFGLILIGIYSLIAYFWGRLWGDVYDKTDIIECIIEGLPWGGIVMVTVMICLMIGTLGYFVWKGICSL